MSNEEYWAIKAQLPEGGTVHSSGYISTSIGHLLLFESKRSAQEWAVNNLAPDWLWVVESINFIST